MKEGREGEGLERREEETITSQHLADESGVYYQLEQTGLVVASRVQ